MIETSDALGFIEGKIHDMGKVPQLSSKKVKLFCILKDTSWLLNLIKESKKDSLLKDSGALKKLTTIKLGQILQDLKPLEEEDDPEIQELIKKIEFLWGVKP